MSLKETPLDDIFKDFPLLENDPNFKVTSDADCNYNCIAWASLYSNVWIQPIENPPKFTLDGVKVDWPTDIPANHELDTYVKYFHHLGYVIECDNHLFEKGYQKNLQFLSEMIR